MLTSLHACAVCLTNLRCPKEACGLRLPQDTSLAQQCALALRLTGAPFPTAILLHAPAAATQQQRVVQEVLQEPQGPVLGP